MRQLFVIALLLCAGFASAADKVDYRAAVSDPSRTAKDRERDLRDHPADVLAIAGIKPGMTVADIFGGGGYYSELVAHVVGKDGKVLLINNPPYDAFAKDTLGPRLADGRLPNVLHTTVDPADLGLKSGSVDVAMIVMSYHDLFYADPTDGWPAIDAGHFLDQIRIALKPGGSLLIVDHAAVAGSGITVTKSLHRIDEEFARRDIAAHGFRFEKSWDGLRSSGDDRSLLVFDPKIRGKTDRFVHLYRKVGSDAPAAPGNTPHR
ncbi:MAG: methyltransferase [Tahibacter sp.]